MRRLNKKQVKRPCHYPASRLLFRTMNTHVFIARGTGGGRGDAEQRVHSVVSAIASGTDTSDLVVTVYLLARRDFWNAHTYTQTITPAVFSLTGRHWEFVRRFGAPENLPERFPLIRMAFGLKEPFPRTIHDVYGWELRCESFDDLLAYTFAHELHHYRRYHLGLHPGEGEQATCRWALGRAAAMGFQVSGQKYQSPRARKTEDDVSAEPNPVLLSRLKRSASQLCPSDLRELEQWTRKRIADVAEKRRQSPMERHFAHVRALPPGAELILTRDSDPRSRYPGQRAVKVRNLRGDSYRVALRTPDGEEWLWPMQWLKAAHSMPPNNGDTP